MASAKHWTPDELKYAVACVEKHGNFGRAAREVNAHFGRDRIGDTLRLALRRRGLIPQSLKTRSSTLAVPTATVDANHKVTRKRWPAEESQTAWRLHNDGVHTSLIAITLNSKWGNNRTAGSVKSELKRQGKYKGEQGSPVTPWMRPAKEPTFGYGPGETPPQPRMPLNVVPKDAELTLSFNTHGVGIRLLAMIEVSLQTPSDEEERVVRTMLNELPKVLEQAFRAKTRRNDLTVTVGF